MTIESLLSPPWVEMQAESFELVLRVLDESKLENIVHIAGVEVELTSGVIPTLATPNYYR